MNLARRLRRRVRYGKRVIPDYSEKAELGVVCTAMGVMYVSVSHRPSTKDQVWSSFHYWTRNISLSPKVPPGSDPEIPSPEITKGVVDLSGRHITGEDLGEPEKDGWFENDQGKSSVGIATTLSLWLGAVYAALVISPSLTPSSGHVGVPHHRANPLCCDDFGIIRLVTYLLTGKSLDGYTPTSLLSDLMCVKGPETRLQPGDIVALYGSTAMHLYVGDGVLLTSRSESLTLDDVEKYGVTAVYRGLVDIEEVHSG